VIQQLTGSLSFFLSQGSRVFAIRELRGLILASWPDNVAVDPALLRTSRAFFDGLIPMLYRTLDLTDANRRQAIMEAAEASSTPSVRKRLRHTEELKLKLLIPHEMLGVWLDCPAYTRLGTLFWRSSRGMVSSISLHIDYSPKEIGDGQTYSDEARKESEWLTPPALEGTYARLAYLVKACSQGEEGFTLKLTGRLPDEGWPRILDALCGDGEDGIDLAKYTIDLPAANQFLSEDFELLPRLRYLRDLPVGAFRIFSDDEPAIGQDLHQRDIEPATVLACLQDLQNGFHDVDFLALDIGPGLARNLKDGGRSLSLRWATVWHFTQELERSSHRRYRWAPEVVELLRGLIDGQIAEHGLACLLNDVMSLSWTRTGTIWSPWED